MPNAINWFEIPTHDIARAAAFYERMTGKALRREVFMSVPHAIFVREGEGSVAGALVHDPRNAPSEKGCVVYLNAGNDLDGWIARAEAAGGKVLLPRTSIGPQGFIAIVIDSEGNRVGLHAAAALAPAIGPPGGRGGQKRPLTSQAAVGGSDR